MSRQSAIASAPIEGEVPWARTTPASIPHPPRTDRTHNPPLQRSTLPRAREKPREPPFDWVYDPVALGIVPSSAASSPPASDNSIPTDSAQLTNSNSSANPDASTRLGQVRETSVPATKSEAATTSPPASPMTTTTRDDGSDGASDRSSRSPAASLIQENETSTSPATTSTSTTPTGGPASRPSQPFSRFAGSGMRYFVSNTGGSKLFSAASATATVPTAAPLTIPAESSSASQQVGVVTPSASLSAKPASVVSPTSTSSAHSQSATSPPPSVVSNGVSGKATNGSPTGSISMVSTSTSSSSGTGTIGTEGATSPGSSVVSAALDPTITHELLELFESNDKKYQSLAARERQLAQVCGSAVRMLQAEERDGGVLSGTIQRVRQTRKYLLQRISNPRWEVPHHYHTTALEHSLGRRQANVMEVGEMITGHLALYALARSTTLSQKLLIFALNKAKKKRAEMSEPVREIYKQLCSLREEIKQVRLVLDEVTSKVQKLPADINNPAYVKLKDLVKRYVAASAGPPPTHRREGVRHRYLQMLQVPVSYPSVATATLSAASGGAATAADGTTLDSTVPSTTSLVGDVSTSASSGESQGADQQLGRVKELLKSLESEVAEFMRAESEREQQRAEASAASEAQFYATEYWGPVPSGQAHGIVSNANVEAGVSGAREALVVASDGTDDTTNEHVVMMVPVPQLGGAEDDDDDETRLLNQGAKVVPVHQLVPDGGEFGIEPAKEEEPMVVDGLGVKISTEAKEAAVGDKASLTLSVTVDQDEATSKSSNLSSAASGALESDADSSKVSSGAGRERSHSSPTAPASPTSPSAQVYSLNRFKCFRASRQLGSSHGVQTSGEATSNLTLERTLSGGSTGSRASTTSTRFMFKSNRPGENVAALIKPLSDAPKSNVAPEGDDSDAEEDQ